jgi:Kdo2-lipid IVA lauroyltransferase/acyltransferase
MKRLGFYLFYSVNWIITLLPLPALYLFSDLFYYLLFYLFSYRRKVVHDNLTRAFPQKSMEEIRKIEKKFYRHLADLMVETLKMTHLSRKEHRKRFNVENPWILDDFANKKTDVVGITGHYNNWEWSSILSTYTNINLAPVYKPLSNTHFDSFMRRIRSKYGAILTPMSQIVREIFRSRKANTPVLAGIAGDQTPAKNEINYWTTFLNQDTPVFTGAGKIASKFGMAVVFLNIEKVRRGHYNMKIETLFDDCSGIDESVITEAHVRRLEEVIMERPEYWLWSHRRWKHTRVQVPQI